MKEINPSHFNRRITVKRAATLADDAGGTENDGFDVRFESWASVEEISTARKAYYGLDLFTSYWEIILRYSPNRTFDTSDLIDYGSQTYSVQSADVIKQGYKEFTILICVLSQTT